LQPALHGPGLLLALPQPIDEVVRVSTRSVQEIQLNDWAWESSPYGAAGGYKTSSLHPVEDGYTLTGDANIIRAKFSVRYQVSGPVAYVLNAKNQSAPLESILYRAVTGVIAHMRVDDVLASGLNDLRQEAMNVAQIRLDQLGLGVQLLAFEVREITPARQVLPSFEEVVSARVESRTRVEEANSYRASQLPAAQAEGYRIKQETDAYAQELAAKATGEAAAFEAIERQYRAAPELMRTRLYADAIETILHNLQSATILQPKGGNLKLLLPPGANTR
jgi:HflK protein